MINGMVKGILNNIVKTIVGGLLVTMLGNVGFDRAASTIRGVVRDKRVVKEKYSMSSPMDVDTDNLDFKDKMYFHTFIKLGERLALTKATIKASAGVTTNS